MKRWLVALSLLGALLAGCGSRSEDIAAIGLSGRLVYTQAEDGLWEVNLETGKVDQLWKSPESAQLYGVAVSPTGSAIALGYSPPSRAEGLPWPDLYRIDRDGSNLQPLVQHRGPFESFDYPAWSPDGRWLYFTRSDVQVNEDQSFGDPIIELERIPAGGGQPEVVISYAEQASISVDGSRVTYLHFDLESLARSIWVADIDGSNAVQLLADDRFFDVASPKFSLDGETIAFAGSGPIQPATFWPEDLDLLSWLSGAQPAYAHGLPWDFWTIPVTGGEPTKLTDWATDGAVLSWSPLSGQLGLMHFGGLYVMGSGEPLFLTETPQHGGLDWTTDFID